MNLLDLFRYSPSHEHGKNLGRAEISVTSQIGQAQVLARVLALEVRLEILTKRLEALEKKRK